MQIKNLLSKTLLVAGLMSVGSVAWADDTPYNISSSESAYVDATDDASKAATHNGASLSDLLCYNVQVRNWKVAGNSCNAKFNTGGKLALYKFPLAAVASETGTLKSATVKITVNSTGDGNNVIKFGVFGYNGSQDWTGAALTYNTLTNTGANDLGYTVDYSASFPILDVNSQDLSGNAGTVLNVSALTYVQSALDAGSSYVSFAVSNNSTRVGNLNVSATLTLVYSSATATTYTVNYLDALDNVLKTAAVYNTFEGETYTASSSDMATFYSNDFTKVYTYKSGNDSKAAVADPASNVINLVFDVADNAQYTHTINATGDVSKDNIASITLYEGQTGTVYYNKYIQDGGNWYYTNTNGNSGSSISYGVSVSATGSTNKSYTSASITNFIEVEKMNKSHSWASDGTATRASNGKAPRFYSNSYAFTEPIAEGGTYNITLGGRGVANSATVDLYVGTKSSNTAVTDMVSKGAFSSWSNAGIAEITINDVVVEPGQVIVLKNPNEENNCYVETDYIYYTKTADYTVSKTIDATCGWATYCSPYALDFSGEIANLEGAYFVTGGDGSTLTLSDKITGKVPANTGILLKGSGACTIPVATTSDVDASSNKLVGVTTQTSGVAAGIYVLLYGANDETGPIGFYKTTTAFTVGANSAYLPDGFDDATARTFFGFGDQFTGISTVQVSTAEGSEIYNLQGQRVAQPTKGLYIMNGKKVIVK